MASRNTLPRSVITAKLIEDSSEAGKSAVEDNGVNGGVSGDEVLQDDPDTVERMSVQQLKLKLRSIGVPAKGNKYDLVCALKSVLKRKVNGEDSIQMDDHALPEVESVASLDSRQAKSSSFNINKISKVSRFKKSAGKVKHGPDGNNINEVEMVVCASRQKLLIKTDKKLTPSKRRVPLETTSLDVGASDIVEPWTILSHKKPQKGWIAYNPKTMRPPLTDDTEHVKLMSWNVNGLRALMKSESFSAWELAQRENFDVLCLQETKLQEKDVQGVKECLLEGYDNSFWTCSISKLGYSGAAIISRIKPHSVRYGLGHSDLDNEGRVVTVEFDNFYLISGYVPNSGDGLKRLPYRIGQWDPSLSKYMKELEQTKPVILAGDLNCAHGEIDIYDPKGNKRSAGFTDEERRSFVENFLERGFVDTFRKQHPGVVGYTYWGYRHGGRRTNKGWRLDYFLVSESMAEKVHDSYILPDVTGSDHCPIGLLLKN